MILVIEFGPIIKIWCPKMNFCSIIGFQLKKWILSQRQNSAQKIVFRLRFWTLSQKWDFVSKMGLRPKNGILSQKWDGVSRNGIMYWNDLLKSKPRSRPQEVVPGNFAGSEMWRSIQTIENAKGRVNSFIQGRGVKFF